MVRFLAHCSRVGHCRMTLYSSVLMSSAAVARPNSRNARLLAAVDDQPQMLPPSGPPDLAVLDQPAAEFVRGHATGIAFAWIGATTAFAWVVRKP